MKDLLLSLSLLMFYPALAEPSEAIQPKYPKYYVSVSLKGQFGNQLFQIATAYAYALDHDLPLLIPDLVQKKEMDIPHNAKKIFLNKLSGKDPIFPPYCKWREPSFNYTKIPPCKQVLLKGFFSSEKYFKHRRAEILKLFECPSDLKGAIFAKYPFLETEALVVGVQIRDYRKEYPMEDSHPTHKRNYYKKAMSYFPEEAIFLVSSNNPAFAKECTEGIRQNIIYLNEEDYIDEFYTLTFCKSFIISNSTFGWWAAWLSTSENKTVIAPNPWFAPPYDNEQMRQDLLPEGTWVINVE